MPGINRIEQSCAVGLIKLVWCISPCLEERIRQKRVAHDAASQRTSQDSPAPCPVKEPVIGHIMVVTDRIRSDVRECPTHLWQGRSEHVQPIYMLCICGFFSAL